MCGIVGYVGPEAAGPILLQGLKRLEYRGYDSAGMALLNGSGVQVVKRSGKLSSLRRQSKMWLPSVIAGLHTLVGRHMGFPMNQMHTPIPLVKAISHSSTTELSRMLMIFERNSQQ